MKRKLLSLIGLLGLGTSLVFGQTALTQTTTSAAIGAADTVIAVTSATGITGRGANNLINSILVIDQEAMHVLGTAGTQISVLRSQEGTARQSHASGAMVLVGTPAQLRQSDPQGSCTSTNLPVLPIISIGQGGPASTAVKLFTCANGNYEQINFLPSIGDFNGVGAILASATTIAPTNAIHHVSGTVAVVTVTPPAGFTTGCIVLIPDAVFTWTAAGNISLAGTAVVNKALNLCFDGTKWSPGYIAFNSLPLELQFARGLPV